MDDRVVALPVTGDATHETVDAWNALAVSAGSPFHTVEFVSLVTRFWPGDQESRHVVLGEAGAVDAIVPAFLVGSCPRLDYYRAKVTPSFSGTVLLSHALVGWYGFPLVRTPDLLPAAIEAFAERAADERAAAALFGGIDGRDATLLAGLADEGFVVGRATTLMTRALEPEDAEDPTRRLKRSHRHVARNQLAQARRAGVRIRSGTSDDAEGVPELVGALLDSSDVPRAAMPNALLASAVADPPQGMDMLVAEVEGRVVAALLAFRCGSRYLNWVAGFEPEAATAQRAWHALVDAAIRTAAATGCTEIQAGRGVTEFKLRHGFRPVPLLFAGVGRNRGDQTRVDRWLSALDRRWLRQRRELLGSETASSAAGAASSEGAGAPEAR
jgi:Acetyltransferase (GNAT) domain